MMRITSNPSNYWAVVLAVFSFFLYLNTLAPTVVWGDSAKLATFVNDVELKVRLEYHPLHTLLGQLFNSLPIGHCAYRLNLMSAFFGALTIGLLYLVLMRWTRLCIAALGGALALTVSHVFWLLSVITESYTLFTFLLAMMLWLMTLWDEKKENYLLYLAAFTFGISLSNNLLMPFFLPGFVYFYFSAQNRPHLTKYNWLFILLSSGLGASILIGLGLKSLLMGGQDLFDLVAMGPFKRYYRSPAKILFETIRYPLYLMYQFPIIGFAVGLFGAWSQIESHSERRKLCFLLILLLANIVFASGYMRQKQFFLMIGSFVVFSIWIGIGISALSSWAHRRGPKYKAIGYFTVLSITLVPVIFYFCMPTIVKKYNLDLVKARSLSYRDNTRFFLVPAKHNEYGAERFGKEVFLIAAPKSIIIADFTPIAVLRYYQKVHKMRKDVWLKLIDFEPLDLEFVDRYINQRPIYLADDLEPDYNIAGLKTKYNLIRVGPIIKIEPKSGERGHNP
jgi:hypothetical protein